MKKRNYRKVLSTFLAATVAMTSFAMPTVALAKDKDVIEGEYVVTVESLEMAEAVAKAYGMELVSYGYEVAVLKEMEEDATLSEIISDFVDGLTDEDLDFELPELYENVMFTLCYTGEFEVFTISDAAISSSSIGSSQYHHDIIHTEEAWTQAEDKGDGITVAIVDTGIYMSHNEFKSITFVDSYNSEDDTYGNDYVADDHGHGTHVAGIVAGATGGLAGGVAPNVDLMIIKGDNDDHEFSMASLTRAIKHATEEGADIISMSLGTTSNPNYPELEQAIENAVTAGVTIICAAGNDYGKAVNYPAAYDETIAVGAIDEDLSIASYTNIGDEVDVVAPGTDILSAYYIGSNQYAYSSGTSMATPIVSGIAALILEMDSSLSPEDMRARLTGTSREAGDLGWDKYYGFGVVDAYGAVLGIDDSDMNEVTYEYNDESGKTSTTYVADGVTLIKPTDPTGDDDFLGWATEVQSSSYFDFSKTISDDMTLYAQWNVNMDTQDAPTGLATTEVTANSVTLAAITDAEYGISRITTAPSTWQDETTFTGLSANTTYYFFARMKATDTQLVSDSSAALAVTTLEVSIDFSGDDTNADSISGTYGTGDWSSLVLTRGYSATIEDSAVISGEYTLSVHDTSGSIVDTSEAPEAGTYTYEILFTSSDNAYTNVVADSGTVTIAQLPAEITWGSTTFGYTGQDLVPSATVSNLVEGDSVSVVVSGAQTEVGSNYVATANSLSGADAGNYSLATTTTTFAITQVDGEIGVGTADISATYGDSITLTATITAPIGVTPLSVEEGVVTFTVGETELGSVSGIDASGDTATLVYDTRKGGLALGENKITVTYSGSSNMGEAEEVDVITVDLSAKTITSSMVTSISSQTYTGSEITPTVTITDGTTTLTLDKDYTVAYSDNIAVGTATVTITGMGYYSDSTSATFAISSSSTSTSSSSGGGGGGGGSSSGGITVDTEDDTTTATLKISASTSGKTTTAGVEKDDMEDAIEDALDEVADDGEAIVELDVNTKSYTTKMNLTITADALKAVADSEIAQLNIASDMGEMYWSKEFVEYLSDLADGDDILVVVESVDSDSVLTDAQKLMMGDIVAYDLSIYVGDTYVDDFNGEKIRVILPFTVADGENANHIVVWYLDDDKDKTVIASTYDSYKKEVGFYAEHFSYYLIGYDADSVLSEDVEEEEEVVAVLAEEEVTTGENPFTDVSESDFFYNPVMWAVANGITSGTTETTFGSYDTATRGQTVTLIWKAMGSPEPTLEENPFVDIADTDYFYKAVLWAVENSVASGTDVDTFSPNATVTRGQIVTFLWNNAGRPEANAENPFVDVPSDMYYYNAILWAVAEGITSGTSADTFEPETLCDRGQIVTFLYRNLA